MSNRGRLKLDQADEALAMIYEEAWKQLRLARYRMACQCETGIGRRFMQILHESLPYPYRASQYAGCESSRTEQDHSAIGYDDSNMAPVHDINGPLPRRLAAPHLEPSVY